MGGQPRLARQMERFRHVVDVCQFRDLGYSGAKFSWSRHFENGVSIWARLDLALANKGWMWKFPNASVHHISTPKSDHCMLSLHWNQTMRSRLRTEKLFRFKAMWLRDPQCLEVISEAWDRGLASFIGYSITNFLQSCKEALTRWNKVEFGQVGWLISSLKNQLQLLESQPDLHREKIRRMRKELNSWLDSEEVMW